MKPKKLLSIFLAAVILIAALPFGIFNVSAATSETTGDCTWTLDGTVLTISGNGAMADYELIVEDFGSSSLAYSSSPWSSSSITDVIIEEGVTYIGNWSFFGFAGGSALKRITIPDSVTSIGNSAFSDCYELTSVNITDLKAWCEIDFDEYSSNPLSYAKNLYLNGKLVTELVIPEGITEIKKCAFEGCSSLTSITIPDGVTSIGNYAFSGCSSLTSVSIPDSVTSIGSSAFYNCSSLTSITIPDSVTSIGYSAFYKCNSLNYNIYDSGKYLGNESNKYVVLMDTTSTDITSFDFASGVKFIYDSAFSGCSSLTSVTIPNSVTSIGGSAFSGCSALKDIYYCGSEDKWLDIRMGIDNDYLYSATVHYLVSVASVEITSLPEKLEYIEGCEELDLTGGELTVTYTDGSSSVRELTDGEITATGFDNSVLGEQTITIMYRDYSASFKVKVVERKLGSVAFSVPNTKEYIQGEALKLEGGGITLHYTDGGTEAVALTLDMLSGYDTEKIGEQYVCISYKGDAVYYKITVYLNGDLDGDGTVASSDLALLRKTLLGISSGNRRYDVNGNGVIDIVDLVRIKKIAAD